MVEFDTLRGAEFDLSKQAVWDALFERVRAGDFDAIMLSPPCGTFSRARFHFAGSSGPRPLRTKAHPRGFRGFGILTCRRPLWPTSLSINALNSQAYRLQLANTSFLSILSSSGLCPQARFLAQSGTFLPCVRWLRHGVQLPGRYISVSLGQTLPSLLDWPVTFPPHCTTGSVGTCWP